MRGVISKPDPSDDLPQHRSGAMVGADQRDLLCALAYVYVACGQRRRFCCCEATRCVWRARWRTHACALMNLYLPGRKEGANDATIEDADRAGSWQPGSDDRAGARTHSRDDDSSDAVAS